MKASKGGAGKTQTNQNNAAYASKQSVKPSGNTMTNDQNNKYVKGGPKGGTKGKSSKSC